MKKDEERKSGNNPAVLNAGNTTQTDVTKKKGLLKKLIPSTKRVRGFKGFTEAMSFLRGHKKGASSGKTDIMELDLFSDGRYVDFSSQESLYDNYTDLLAPGHSSTIRETEAGKGYDQGTTGNSSKTKSKRGTRKDKAGSKDVKSEFYVPLPPKKAPDYQRIQVERTVISPLEALLLGDPIPVEQDLPEAPSLPPKKNPGPRKKQQSEAEETHIYDTLPNRKPVLAIPGLREALPARNSFKPEEEHSGEAAQAPIYDTPQQSKPALVSQGSYQSRPSSPESETIYDVPTRKTPMSVAQHSRSANIARNAFESQPEEYNASPYGYPASADQDLPGVSPVPLRKDLGPSGKQQSETAETHIYDTPPSREPVLAVPGLREALPARNSFKPEEEHSSEAAQAPIYDTPQQSKLVSVAKGSRKVPPPVPPRRDSYPEQEQPSSTEQAPIYSAVETSVKRSGKTQQTKAGEAPPVPEKNFDTKAEVSSASALRARSASKTSVSVKADSSVKSDTKQSQEREGRVAGAIRQHSLEEAVKNVRVNTSPFALRKNVSHVTKTNVTLDDLGTKSLRALAKDGNSLGEANKPAKAPKPPLSPKPNLRPKPVVGPISIKTKPMSDELKNKISEVIRTLPTSDGSTLQGLEERIESLKAKSKNLNLTGSLSLGEQLSKTTPSPSTPTSGAKSAVRASKPAETSPPFAAEKTTGRASEIRKAAPIAPPAPPAPPALPTPKASKGSAKEILANLGEAVQIGLKALKSPSTRPKHTKPESTKTKDSGEEFLSELSVALKKRGVVNTGVESVTEPNNSSRASNKAATSTDKSQKVQHSSGISAAPLVNGAHNGISLSEELSSKLSPSQSNLSPSLLRKKSVARDESGTKALSTPRNLEKGRSNSPGNEAAHSKAASSGKSTPSQSGGKSFVDMIRDNQSNTRKGGKVSAAIRLFENNSSKMSR